MKYKIILSIAIGLLSLHYSLAGVFYVSINGSDTYGDGSAAKPWRTLRYAVTRVAPDQGHTIQLGAGTFIEGGQVVVPTGVNVQGAGKTATIIKATTSFYYHPATPDYAAEKYLMILKSPVQASGNQTLKSFTIDGDSKQLHGGIYVRNRDKVFIEDITVQNTNFNGIWFWDVKDCNIKKTNLVNCSWGSSGYCAGALHLGNIERVEIDHLDIDESIGYGIKTLGPSDENNIFDLKIHDSRISVNPYGLWDNGTAPNIAIELFQDNLSRCEIFNTYVDNTISVVTTNRKPPSGIQTIRIHHNTIDIAGRSKGSGYGVELTMHDVEVDHNYFIKGSYGIANWLHPMQNWNIHHNVFYALEGVYPGDILRSQQSGLHNVNFYNNTIEFTGEKTMNVIGVYGGTSNNVNIFNNLFINNNTGYSYYPNSFIHTENGATINNLVVKNNFFDRLPVSSFTGTYSANLEGDPRIYQSGERADPYYQPTPASPLLGRGLGPTLQLPALTSDIGAFKFNEELFNTPPEIALSSPTNASNFYTGSMVTLSATASDSTGTINSVKFFNGVTEMGEDSSAPYSFSTDQLTEGAYSFTAVATDNFGASDTSEAVNIKILPWTRLDLYAHEASLSGYMLLTSDSTAFKGSYFSIPAGHGTNYTLGSSNAQFNFNLEETDTYTIWVRVRTHGPENQAYYIYDGKGNWTTWMAGLYEGWKWVKITDAYTNNVATFPFTKGPNLLVFSWLHDNVHVDGAIITNNNDFLPSEKSGTTSGRMNGPKESEIGGPQSSEIKKGIVVYPNPAKGPFTISYESPVAQQARLKMTTLTSVVAKELILDLHAGLNIIELDSDNLSKGIYFISFITSTGEVFDVKTIISR